MTTWTRACNDAQACIEGAPTGMGNVTLRNSGEPRYTVVADRQEFAEFLAAVKRGEFDHLTGENT
jgi:hypothetical protein